tara:strand:+ start:264 stop:827 length:564 start_codon:yes stop_codon:yes gene_type:complete
MTPAHRNEHDQAEIRLLGLILMQSMSIGLAVGIFDTGIWLRHTDPFVNGMTYAMGAFAIQGLAYYVFKMFFQQGMDEKARIAQMERGRRNRSSAMSQTFEQRRQDMELRMQETQLDQELRWLEHNPGQVPPWLQQRATGPATNISDFNPTIPAHGNSEEQALELGLSFDVEEEPKRGTDGKFKKQED